MTPAEWLNHLGEKADIVQGELVLSPDGFLTVSTSPGMYVLLVDTWRDVAVPIIPRSEFRGRQYRYRVNDCAKLYAEWSDAVRGTDLVQKVASMSRREYVERTQQSLEDWLLANGFTKVEEPAFGDLILMGAFNHVAAYLGDEKVLHHLEKKLSSIDTLDRSAIVGVYRYGH
jgi:cell wall-associated NlpC family hydrolase